MGVRLIEYPSVSVRRKLESHPQTLVRKTKQKPKTHSTTHVTPTRKNGPQNPLVLSNKALLWKNK